MNIFETGFAVLCPDRSSWPTIEPYLTELGYHWSGNTPADILNPEPRAYVRVQRDYTYLCFGFTDPRHYTDTVLTVEQFLNIVNPDKLSNEQVLNQFLTHYNNRKKFLELSILEPVDVRKAFNFILDCHIGYHTTHYWAQISLKWLTLCDHYNLTGQVDLSKL